MSFILDALKKAEAERQRQTGPTLLEVRVAQPRRRFPTWTIVIGALLAINILLLIVFELRRPAPGAEPAASASTATPAPVNAAPTAAAAPVAAPTAAAAPPAAATTSTPPPAVAPPAVAPAAAPAFNAAAGGNAPSTGPSLPPDADQSGDNPADFEPAVSPSGASAANSSARRARPPSLSDIGGDVPELRLDLHVYAVRPADRYALINMHRVHEGDVLPEGARVVAIDRDGVELNYHGTDFMLHPQ
jgi:general secretion pathway protein B